MTYGWSLESRVFHRLENEARGWVETPCCGERWIAATSETAPAHLGLCKGQIVAEVQARGRRTWAYRPWCSAPNCIRRIDIWHVNLCSMHYKRWMRYGTTELPRERVAS